MSQRVTRGPLFLRGQWKLWFIPHLSLLQLHNQSSGMLRSALSSSWGMGLGHKSYIRQNDTFLPLSVTEIAFIYFLQPENHMLTLIWNDTIVSETKLTPYYTLQYLNVNNQIIPGICWLFQKRSTQLGGCWGHSYIHQGGYVVSLSAVWQRNYWPHFYETWWKVVALAKKEPITIWSVSESQNGYTNYV